MVFGSHTPVHNAWLVKRPCLSYSHAATTHDSNVYWDSLYHYAVLVLSNWEPAWPYEPRVAGAGLRVLHWTP